MTQRGIVWVHTTGENQRGERNSWACLHGFLRGVLPGVGAAWMMPVAVSYRNAAAGDCMTRPPATRMVQLDGIGLNVDTGEYVDLVKAGIIDPAMVTRSALQNAASIAKNIITTECVVADAPESDGGGGMGGMSPNMGGMGMGGGMM